jgi:hypothetical protein
VCVSSMKVVVQSKQTRQERDALHHLIMSIGSPKATSPAQWQTRVHLRSNDGYRYEIDRKILNHSRSVNVIMWYLTQLQWFLCRPLPSPKAASQGSNCRHNQTNRLKDGGDINDAKLTAPAQPSTMDDDFDFDIPFDDLMMFADFMQLTDRFKLLVRSANVELDIGQAGVLLPLIDKFDGEFMRQFYVSGSTV